MYLFRRRLVLAPAASGGQPLRLRVSADQAYALFLGALRIAHGPGPGDPRHWRSQTVDLRPHLQPGAYVLGAVVWFPPLELAPESATGVGPAFVCAAHPDDPFPDDPATPGGWRCLRSTAHRFQAPEGVPSPARAGPSEALDAAAFPWGWELTDFDDSGWQEPLVLEAAVPFGAPVAVARYWLVPDLIPTAEERVEPVEAVVRSTGVEVPNHRLAPDSPVEIPPRTRAVLLLDHGTLAAGYPELVLEGGAGAVVRLRAAEALWTAGSEPRKQRRGPLDGLACLGPADRFVADGQPRKFRPLDWRAFRYLQIEVETGAEGLRLLGLAAATVGAPVTGAARFRCSDQSLHGFWETALRTSRLCAEGAFLQDPYSSRAQDTSDARIQARLWHLTAGDGRLPRNALALVREAVFAEGLVPGRAPCRSIPAYPSHALSWVGMVHDCWMFQDDAVTVRDLLPTVRGVLEWWRSRIARDGPLEGLPGPLEWSHPLDDAAFPEGAPGAAEGGSALLALLLALALREGAELERALGIRQLAGEYRDDADRLARTVRRRCWDAEHRLLRDTPEAGSLSQHGQALGILAGALEGREALEAAWRLARALGTPAPSAAMPSAGAAVPPGPGETVLVPAGLVFRGTVHRALRAAGLGDLFLDWLEPWRKMLALGMTTFAADPDGPGPECRGACAHPAADLLSLVLGIEPAAPGFRDVLVTPHLGRLEHAEGAIPHPAGEVVVGFRREGQNLAAEIELPPRTAGTLVVGRERRPLRPGKQVLTLPAPPLPRGP